MGIFFGGIEMRAEKKKSQIFISVIKKNIQLSVEMEDDYSTTDMR